MMDRPVVIIGAGPVGATQALLLAKHGIPVRLIERKQAPTQHPAAHVLNGRTMEIWESIDPEIPRRVTALAEPIKQDSTINWQTSLMGDVLGKIEVLRRDAEREVSEPISNWSTIHLGQHRLEPLLWDLVQHNELIEFQTGTQCSSVEERDGRVFATIERRQSRRVVECAYLISAEGASSNIRRELGIAMPGPVFAEMSSVFFNCPALVRASDPLPILTWVMNETILGALIHHGEGDFILMTGYLPKFQSRESMDEGWWLPRIRAAIGTDAPVLIKSRGVWTMTSQIAERYRKDRIFLVGDAAHRFPPTGGYGLNTGVGDAQNLAWKLAAVVSGEATDTLLGTYEQERKPVAMRNAEQSVHNHRKMDLVSRHIGVRGEDLNRLGRLLFDWPLSALPHAWRARFAKWTMVSGVRRAGRLLNPASKGFAERLAWIQADIAQQGEHFSAPGIEFGSTYDDGLVAREPGQRVSDDTSAGHYEPSTLPGGRIPLAAIADKEATTHSILKTDRLSLLVDPRDQELWRRLVSNSTVMGLEIAIVPCSMRKRNDWQDVFGLCTNGAVLTRPDGYVLWRSIGHQPEEDWNEFTNARGRDFMAQAGEFVSDLAVVNEV